jgi:hypothetical protein
MTIRLHSIALPVRQAVEELWGPGVGGCHIASIQLTTILRSYKYKATFVLGEFSILKPHSAIKRGQVFDEHCWVETPRYIIDVTADQFGRYPPVLITKRSDRRYATKNRGWRAICTVDTDWESPNDKFWRTELYESCLKAGIDRRRLHRPRKGKSI